MILVPYRLSKSFSPYLAPLEELFLIQLLKTCRTNQLKTKLLSPIRMIKACFLIAVAPAAQVEKVNPVGRSASVAFLNDLLSTSDSLAAVSSLKSAAPRGSSYAKLSGNDLQVLLARIDASDQDSRCNDIPELLERLRHASSSANYRIGSGFYYQLFARGSDCVVPGTAEKFKELYTKHLLDLLKRVTSLSSFYKIFNQEFGLELPTRLFKLAQSFFHPGAPADQTPETRQKILSEELEKILPTFVLNSDPFYIALTAGSRIERSALYEHLEFYKLLNQVLMGVLHSGITEGYMVIRQTQGLPQSDQYRGIMLDLLNEAVIRRILEGSGQRVSGIPRLSFEVSDPDWLNDPDQFVFLDRQTGSISENALQGLVVKRKSADILLREFRLHMPVSGDINGIELYQRVMDVVEAAIAKKMVQEDSGSYSDYSSSSASDEGGSHEDLSDKPLPAGFPSIRNPSAEENFLQNILLHPKSCDPHGTSADSILEAIEQSSTALALKLSNALKECSTQQTAPVRSPTINDIPSLVEQDLKDHFKTQLAKSMAGETEFIQHMSEGNPIITSLERLERLGRKVGDKQTMDSILADIHPKIQLNSNSFDGYLKHDQKEAEGLLKGISGFPNAPRFSFLFKEEPDSICSEIRSQADALGAARMLLRTKGVESTRNFLALLESKCLVDPVIRKTLESAALATGVVFASSLPMASSEKTLPVEFPDPDGNMYGWEIEAPLALPIAESVAHACPFWTAEMLHLHSLAALYQEMLKNPDCKEELSQLKDAVMEILTESQTDSKAAWKGLSRIFRSTARVIYFLTKLFPGRPDEPLPTGDLQDVHEILNELEHVRPTVTLSAATFLPYVSSTFYALQGIPIGFETVDQTVGSICVLLGTEGVQEVWIKLKNHLMQKMFRAMLIESMRDSIIGEEQRSTQKFLVHDPDYEPLLESVPLPIVAEPDLSALTGMTLSAKQAQEHLGNFGVNMRMTQSMDAEEFLKMVVSALDGQLKDSRGATEGPPIGVEDRENGTDSGEQANAFSSDAAFHSSTGEFVPDPVGFAPTFVLESDKRTRRKRRTESPLQSSPSTNTDSLTAGSGSVAAPPPVGQSDLRLQQTAPHAHSEIIAQSPSAATLAAATSTEEVQNQILATDEEQSDTTTIILGAIVLIAAAGFLKFSYASDPAL